MYKIIHSQIKTADQLINRLNEIIYSEESTPSFKRLAQYIIGNYKFVAFMTAAEIATEAKVSQPTVTRFVNKMLNFNGYTTFIKFIHEIARNELSGLDRYQSISSDQKSLMKETINRDLENLSDILRDIPEEKLKRIGDKISNSKNVFIVGLRTGSHVANYFYFLLNKIHPNVMLCTQDGIKTYEMLNKIDKSNSIVISFVFPRYSNEMISILEYIRDEKFNYITITDSYTLELWKITECTLVTPINISTLFDSYVTSYAILNLLLHFIGETNKKRTEKMLETSEKLLHRKGFFYRRND